MPVKVLFVCGPRRSGKSIVIEKLIARHNGPPPHYLRLVAINSDKHPPSPNSHPVDQCRVASARWVTYDSDHVFEVLYDALTKTHNHDRKGVIIIEAEADPLLRQAYPYDFRLFVMRAPTRESELFRPPDQAAVALTAALHDTGAFARDIFGLAEEDGDKFDIDAREKRDALTKSQWRYLMNSPLGDELATRILLQPSHNGLIEADILLVNTEDVVMSPVLELCLRRLEGVLAHARGPDGRRKVPLVCCDPGDPEDPRCDALYDPLDKLLRSANGYPQ